MTPQQKQMYKQAKTKRRRAIQRDRWTKRIQEDDWM